MKRNKIIKELRDWGILIIIFIVLYTTGLHTHVVAFAQRIFLETGLITATELPDDKKKDANFNMKLKSLQSGNTIDFKDFKGNVIFINFWASWCAPCIAEMPNIQKLYNRIESDKIKFILISLDDTEEKAKNFIDKRDFTFPTYMPVSSVPEVYKSPSIPTTFVISPEGKIVAKKVGMANYNKRSFRKFLLDLSSGI